jgi:hypothetical protein
MRAMSVILIASALVLPSTLIAQVRSEGRTQWVPSSIQWEAVPGGVTVPGMQQAVLSGDPNGSGRYTIRLRLPAGYKMAPHAYDDSREVTVISGILHFSYGDKYAPEGYTTLPPGSFFTEAAPVI